VETSAGRKKGANEENAENEERWSKRNKNAKREASPIKNSREREVFRWRNGIQVWLTTPKQGM
jgi:hypothetical protein